MVVLVLPPQPLGHGAQRRPARPGDEAADRLTIFLTRGVELGRVESGDGEKWVYAFCVSEARL